MYVKRNYGFWMTLNWSKMPFIYGFFYSLVVTGVYIYAKNNFDISVTLPWAPIGVIGISVAFYLGFKNNASYDRTWEARKIWGGIVNNSRSFGAAVCSFVQGDDAENIRRKLIYRHVAWLTALRFQLRISKEWEHVEERVKNDIFPDTSDKYFEKLDKELCKYLDEKEINSLIHLANPAAQILKNQAVALQALRDKGYFEDFRHMEFHKLVSTFYDDQGRSERIKNFPFPRQYASTALWQTMIFSALIPFGLIEYMSGTEHSAIYIWLTAPLSALTIWIFFLMEKIGDYSENPFEGSYNDIPITSMARGIEIDLRQMIVDDNIPDAEKAMNGFLM